MAKKNDSLTRVLSVIVGLVLMVGALVAWHQFHIDGLLAWIIAGAGATAIGHGLGIDLNV
jgi:hypothetical protein